MWSLFAFDVNLRAWGDAFSLSALSMSSAVGYLSSECDIGVFASIYLKHDLKLQRYKYLQQS